MIPDYLTFTRYQDKRVIIYLYLLTMFLLFLFWKNNGYNLLPSNVLSLSVILALIVFSFIYELKNYWGYKCVMKHIDFSCFQGKAISSYEAFLWRQWLPSHTLRCFIFSLLAACRLCHRIMHYFVLLLFRHWLFTWRLNMHVIAM